MIQVITSFDEKYYNLIGKDCVDSFLSLWDSRYQLTCYVENFEISWNSRIRQIGFDQLDPDYAVLQTEDFHSSVKRFAKKAYSFMHAMHHGDQDWILWIDADVVTQQAINWELWSHLLKPGCLSLYMGVNYTTDKQGMPGQWLVPETGVFAVNRHHRDFAVFRDEYCRRYHQRDQRGLRRFYDNDVFGAAINLLPQARRIDLCHGFTKPYKTPLAHTVLGPYLKHYKAKHSKAEYAQDNDDQ